MNSTNLWIGPTKNILLKAKSFEGNFDNGFINHIVYWLDKIPINLAYVTERLLISSTLGRSKIVGLQVFGAFMLRMVNRLEST